MGIGGGNGGEARGEGRGTRKKWTRERRKTRVAKDEVEGRKREKKKVGMRRTETKRRREVERRIIYTFKYNNTRIKRRSKME